MPEEPKSEKQEEEMTEAEWAELEHLLRKAFQAHPKPDLEFRERLRKQLLDLAAKGTGDGQTN